MLSDSASATHRNTAYMHVKYPCSLSYRIEVENLSCGYSCRFNGHPVGVVHGYLPFSLIGQGFAKPVAWLSPYNVPDIRFRPIVVSAHGSGNSCPVLLAQRLAHVSQYPSHYMRTHC